MGLMALNLATLNVRGLRDPGKCTRLLGELKTLGVDVAAVQETHFTCVPTVVCWKAILTFSQHTQPYQRWGFFASWTQP